jgi:hypothetical protein
MPALLPVVLLTASRLVLASSVPNLNIAPSCQAAIAASIGHNRDNGACLRDESQAHSKLQQQWRQFSGAEHAQCLKLSRLGGDPSYVELLTCLQLAKAAENIPGDARKARAAR